MKQDSQELYFTYQSITQKAADLQNASAVLQWDQEVYMPKKGFAFRGRQLATLAAQAHEAVTSKTYGDMLRTLLDRTDLREVQRINVLRSYEDYEKNTKLPSSFVEALAQQSSASFNAWIQAREVNDFIVYQEQLAKMISLKKQQAAYYGYEGHPYNALLDDYEKGATTTMLDPVFETVRNELPVLLQLINKAPQVADGFFNRYFPRQQQWDFSIEVLRAMGYDMEAGRQDLSEHPFTTSFAVTDVRITTRVNEHDLASLLWSTIHEGGHALYEQGLPESEYGMPLGMAASLSIHESQSRLWENCVGRSLPFWRYFYPKLQQCFREQLTDVPLDEFYKGMNRVKPSRIRTEADEVTYHFHVMIRYELEKGLIGGSMDAKDLPEIWNEHYEQYLGISPGNDKEGVLQDVHWSHGSFGYFPTYSLGSFYAAQFFEQAVQDIPDLQAMMETGNFEALLHWLREQIHRKGRRYYSDELCRQVTGRGLDFSFFMRYLKNKYYAIYGLN